MIEQVREEQHARQRKTQPVVRRVPKAAEPATVPAAEGPAGAAGADGADGEAAASKKRRRRRRKPAGGGEAGTGSDLA